MAATSGKITTVGASAAAVQLLPGNVNRRADATGPSAVVNNNGSTVLFVLMSDGQAANGGEVTTSNYTYQVPVAGNLELWGYRGAVRGIWTGAPTGNAAVTELL